MYNREQTRSADDLRAYENKLREQQQKRERQRQAREAQYEESCRQAMPLAEWPDVQPGQASLKPAEVDLESDASNNESIMKEPLSRMVPIVLVLLGSLAVIVASTWRLLGGG